VLLAVSSCSGHCCLINNRRSSERTREICVAYECTRMEGNWPHRCTLSPKDLACLCEVFWERSAEISEKDSTYNANPLEQSRGITIRLWSALRNLHGSRERDLACRVNISHRLTNRATHCTNDVTGYCYIVMKITRLPVRGKRCLVQPVIMTERGDAQRSVYLRTAFKYPLPRQLAHESRIPVVSTIKSQPLVRELPRPIRHIKCHLRLCYRSRTVTVHIADFRR